MTQWPPVLIGPEPTREPFWEEQTAASMPKDRIPKRNPEVWGILAWLDGPAFYELLWGPHQEGWYTRTLTAHFEDYYEWKWKRDLFQN